MKKKHKTDKIYSKSPFLVVGLGFCFVFIIIGIIVYNICTFSITEETQTFEPSKEESTVAPDFKVYDENGEEVCFSSFLGKPVVIYTWTTWKEQCGSELPYYENAWKKYGDKVEFMIINLPDGKIETVDRAKSYLVEKGYTFPDYYDTELNVPSFAYQVLDVPLTVLVDKNGMVAKQWTEEITEDELFENIEELLGE